MSVLSFWPRREWWVLGSSFVPSPSESNTKQQSLLVHGASVPWERAKGSFLCRPSSPVPRLLLFPAWLRWSPSWISWEWVAGEEGGRKAFHQAGKLKKHFGYQALADLAPTPSCLCLVNFPILSLFFLLFFLLPRSRWNSVRLEKRLHLPSDLHQQQAFFKAFWVVQSKHQVSGVKSHKWLQHHSCTGIQRFSYSDFPS